MELGEEFQLTPSRRATLTGGKLTGVKDISTHALTEGDYITGNLCLIQDISTHALTEGDYRMRKTIMMSEISTHALTEGDLHPREKKPLPENFNSRPHGGRRATASPPKNGHKISTHALTEGDGFRIIRDTRNL